jgi:hypothetical protein
VAKRVQLVVRTDQGPPTLYNIYFRIILILDKVSAHVLDYMSLSENIKVIFMPPTIAVTQLMDQDMITTSKLYYLCCTLKKLIIETYVNNELTLHEFSQILTLQIVYK